MAARLIGLPQPHAVRPGQPVESLDCRVQELGVGREGDGLGLHGGVDRDAGQVVAAQRAGCMRDPQALGQQKLQSLAEPGAPMAQVGTLVRENVLEELFPGEELEIGVVDPALAHRFVGQREDVLEQQKSDDEAALDARASLVAVERRDLAIEPVPVELARQPHQLVLEVDDLVQPGPEQIAGARRLPLLWSHRSPPMRNGITIRRQRESQK